MIQVHIDINSILFCNNVITLLQNKIELISM